MRVDLEEIEARANAASEGPWDNNSLDQGDGVPPDAELFCDGWEPAVGIGPDRSAWIEFLPVNPAWR